MNLNPATVLDPVFHFLDGMLEKYGVYFYLVFVWLSLAVIVWILNGGLRCKRPQGNSVTIIPGIIFTMQPPIQPPPPIIIADFDPTQNGDNETMD